MYVHIQWMKNVFQLRYPTSVAKLTYQNLIKVLILCYLGKKKRNVAAITVFLFSNSFLANGKKLAMVSLPGCLVRNSSHHSGNFISDLVATLWAGGQEQGQH